MKIKLKGKIGSISKNSNVTVIALDLKGNDQDAPLNAKEATFAGMLHVKPLVADKLRIGSSVSVEITEDDVETP